MDLVLAYMFWANMECNDFGQRLNQFKKKKNLSNFRPGTIPGTRPVPEFLNPDPPGPDHPGTRSARYPENHYPDPPGTRVFGTRPITTGLLILPSAFALLS